MTSRRDVIKASGVLAGVSLLGLTGQTAASYDRIRGANDRLNVAVMGLGGRGNYLMRVAAASQNVLVTHICDVDSNAVATAVADLANRGYAAPVGVADIRTLLDLSDLDAVIVATPDHWHAYATMLCLQAEKHVYVEKPCSHSPEEGKRIVAAQKRYNKVVQMGNQLRSSPQIIELIQLIRAGELGDLYKARCWYGNNRSSIGIGKPVSVPASLDWDLWQGPAPRRTYHDNRVPYNWHWFWNWGTGEAGNNALHQIDIARWALQVNYPAKVTVNASRQFYSTDDWEMYDTMDAQFLFDNGQEIRWEGNSCNKVTWWGRSSATMLYGTKGFAIVDISGYEIFDPDGQRISSNTISASGNVDVVGASDLTDLHLLNFFDAIRQNEDAQASPIEEGEASTLMCHLANIAYRLKHPLNCDSESGLIHERTAASLWSREYAPGWNALSG